MKKSTTARALTALLLLTAMLLSIFCGCTADAGDTSDKDGDENTDPDTGNSGNDNQTSGNDGETGAQKTEYAVKILSAGGLPLEGVNVYVYSDETLDDLDGFAQTDANGSVKIKLPKRNGYCIVLSGVPEGYAVEDKYFFTDTVANITLTSSVIKDTSLTGVSYELGSVMHDFSVITSDGETMRLSEILSEKKAVLLNFWFSTCSPCINEFPFMNSAYEKYKDDIEVLALNHYADDSEDDVAFFKLGYNLTIPMAKDYTGLQKAFGINSYPTSVMVDRYGVICLIEIGGLPAEEPFNAAFDYFSADNYTQQLFDSIDGLTPVEKPDVEMPDSDAIGEVFNKDEIEVTYRPEEDKDAAEFAWPFIIGEKNGVSCIKTSNANKASSYAIMYADITLKKGEAIAFDYISSTELGTDVLIILVNGKDIYQISGVGDNWATCYPYVADEDGVYEVAFAYVKDSTTNDGEDTVYLKDLRIVEVDDIDNPTYIPRNAATNLKENGFGYENYVTVVYNEKDGYYHVGDKNGPLLLASLIDFSNFSDTTIYDMVCDTTGDLYKYYEEFIDYFSYASNSEFTGYCTVNKELRELLETVADEVGLEIDNPDQWLQMCMYYDAYGTNGKQLDDPIRGLSTFSAFEATEGKNNTVTYNRVIMPRGLLYKFVPTRSGAYRITSDSEHEVNGWIFDEAGLSNRAPLYTYEGGERMYNDHINCSMVIYLEKGKEYYIDIAYYDVYQEGTFTFEIKYLASTYELFMVASPGVFTYYESENTGSINEIVAGGINVVLGTDGYYHELRADSSQGSVLYADFTGITNIFDKSLNDMIDLGAFNFGMTEGDQYIKTYIEKFLSDLGAPENADPSDYREEIIAKFKELWGESYGEYAEIYLIEDVIDGIYHGNGNDLTSVAKKYAAMIDKSSATERNGCVKVNAELAELLQKLMDKYTFEGVDNSWTKLCYYYQYFGK